MKGEFTPASYEGYTLTLADGETMDIHLIGSRAAFSASAEGNYSIALLKCEDYSLVRDFMESGSSFTVDIEPYMEEDVLYYLTIMYDAFGATLQTGDNIIFKSGGRVHFWKSVNYEYNLETCKEMWTDDISLQECLEPQNDIECNDPVLIGYSEQICGDASSDWEKAFRIYSFIAGELAYDTVEAASDTGGYQDSAVDLIRDGKGVCEGFANAFTALCRAQGIPAVVQFGIGFSDYSQITERIPADGEYADHAWAAVYLGDKWHFVDPTYDISTVYYGPDDYDYVGLFTQYYLLPLESFSNDHRILDADTRHGVESAGYCGDHATYEITRDGVCHISGSGAIRMPDGVNGFSKVVFEPGSNITEIGELCFCDCDLLTTVILPDTVVKIDDYAFNTCEDLEYIYLPEGLDSIGKMVFDCCDELSYVRIPDSVRDIGECTFDNCPRLYLSVPSRFRDIDSDCSIVPMYVDYR